MVTILGRNARYCDGVSRRNFLRIGGLVAVTCWTPVSAQIQRGVDAFEVLPLPAHQASFQIRGIEAARWHFGPQYPRPFIYPFRFDMTSLTRMGHPGAPNHDHHRSIWFGHADVDRHDFWSDHGGTVVRQKSWYCYENGADECAMASVCGWFDSAGKEHLEQDVILLLREAGGSGGRILEIQTTFRPGKDVSEVVLGKSNFGFLAVRVARSMSAYFGGGEITDARNNRGEPTIFGTASPWMDYSGPIAEGQGDRRRIEIRGITYFSHPENPRHPPKWHVREDGWMGASFCRDDSYTIREGASLMLRYLLLAHPGRYSADRAQGVFAQFSTRPTITIVKSQKQHHQYELVRGANTR